MQVILADDNSFVIVVLHSVISNGCQIFNSMIFIVDVDVCNRLCEDMSTENNC